MASSCCRVAIAGNEIVCGASEMPRITPVSCTGKNPLGTMMYKTDREHQRRDRDHQRRLLDGAAPSAKSCRRTRSYPRKSAPTCGTGGSARCAACAAGACEHIIGVSVSETIAETRIVTASVIANSRNSRPTISPMNSSGISTAISDTVSDTIVNPICAEPLSAACSGDSPFFDIARDVFDHHDRVVDHEAGRDRQRHQRQVVEAVAEQVHHAEGADERQRDGDARNDGRRDSCAGTGK